MASGFPDWLRASALLGQYAGEFVVIAVTEGGQLYALLQGETIDEEIKTVRLDDQGRLSAFVIDSVDAWNRMLTIGNAELAVRLGSSNIYDRRGQVLFLDTFEQGLHAWTEITDGLAADVSLSPLAALASGYSVKLTGGSTADWEAGVEAIVPSRPVGKMGAEFSLSMTTLWDYMQATFYLYTGAQVLYGSIRWHYTGYILQVYDHGTGYVNVGVGKALGFGGNVFNTIKFVEDMDSEMYVRLMFNNQEIDISALNLFVGADVASAPHIKVVVTLISRAANNDAAYLDNVIVTVAEPE